MRTDADRERLGLELLDRSFLRTADERGDGPGRTLADLTSCFRCARCREARPASAERWTRRSERRSSWGWHDGRWESCSTGPAASGSSSSAPTGRSWQPCSPSRAPTAPRPTIASSASSRTARAWARRSSQGATGRPGRRHQPPRPSRRPAELSAASLDQLLDAADAGLAAGNGGPLVTIAPAEARGGTNALLIRPPDAIDPAFGEASFEAHLRAAAAAGAAVQVVRDAGLGFDLDTPEDLERLARTGCRELMRLGQAAPTEPRQWLTPDQATLLAVALPELPEVQPGDDLAGTRRRGLARRSPSERPELAPHDAGRARRHAEGRLQSRGAPRRPARRSCHAPEAVTFARRWDRDPRQVEVVLRESAEVLRMEKGVIISRTRHGYVCANAGVDASNVGRRTTRHAPARRPGPIGARSSATAIAAAFGRRGRQSSSATRSGGPGAGDRRRRARRRRLPAARRPARHDPTPTAGRCTPRCRGRRRDRVGRRARLGQDAAADRSSWCVARPLPAGDGSVIARRRHAPAADLFR